MTYTRTTKTYRVKDGSGAAVAASIGLLLLLVAAGVGLFILTAFVYVWNINDMVANGVNFWNVFWVFLFSLGWFGGSRINVTR